MVLPTSRERKVSYTVAMTPSQIEQIKELADKRQVNVSELIRKLISKELSSEKRDAA
jgi:hypothetical protein